MNPRVIGLSLVYFGAVATNYGLSFFLPQIVKAFGLNTFLTTVVSATPYVVGVVGMVWWGRRSDRMAERRFHTAFPLFVAAAGIAVSTALDDPTLKMISLCLAGFANTRLGPLLVVVLDDLRERQVLVRAERGVQRGGQG